MPILLEIGTKPWNNLPPKNHKEEILNVNPRTRWIGVDIEAGQDVNVVADIQRLSHFFCPGYCNAIFIDAVLEHVARPWTVGEQVAIVTKIGGMVYIETHQTFPLHGYPSDYFRFSTKALQEIFNQELGFKCISTEYITPCLIVPKTNIIGGWDLECEAYLNVAAVFEKVY